MSYVQGSSDFLGSKKTFYLEALPKCFKRCPNVFQIYVNANYLLILRNSKVWTKIEQNICL